MYFPDTVGPDAAIAGTQKNMMAAAADVICFNMVPPINSSLSITYTAATLRQTGGRVFLICYRGKIARPGRSAGGDAVLD